MIPARRLLALTALLAVLGLPLPWLNWPVLLALWAALVGVLALAALTDAWLLWRMPQLDVTRTVMPAWSLGRWQQVALRCSGASRAVRVALFDHYPDDCEVQGLPLQLALTPGEWQQAGYQIKALRRGDHAFGRAELRLSSALGLVERRQWTAAAQTVRVYPDYASVAGYALLATDQRLNRMGVVRKRQRGEGTDFHQLREYRDGDSMRAVDWKATARNGRLISRDYQEERDQQVVLLLDCGRRMQALDGGQAHFDHALNAAILLAWVALRQGDAVGLQTFAGPERWLAPLKTTGSLNRILNGVYDLQPGLQTSDYLQAAQALMGRLRKRALVVIVTNLRDEDNETLLPALKLLRGQHRVMVASLRETALDTVAAAPVLGFEDALRFGATQDYLRQRRESFARLRVHGTDAIDVLPGELARVLVEHYLALKKAGRL
ncbi:hypothetical protein WG78_11290 [Amantichitinum ursilacus]|uniref:DUF58 domain-containing protein n=1 Tax=Amantichitinum ursilacus TaxID=857265 RepID=A0A0N0XJ89_9NEIS|nr:hypothetical protein WG78_11290 [Amantichitinum ursilacus]